MTAFALLFTLSAIGISETVYLIKNRVAAQKPICPIGKDCVLVLRSRWNKIFIIPNDILGLLFYVLVSVVTGFLVIGIEPLLFWSFIIKISVAFGVFLSLFFTYLQWRVIQAWCFWCLMSACTIWLMGITIVISSSV